jgi:conjugative transfer signal peptidase TraF
VLVVVRLGLRINFTPSLPRGLYRAVGGPPARGSIVIACVPPDIAPLALERRYLWRGDCRGGVVPVGKVVLGAAGDTIALTAAGLSVNGQAVPNSRPVARDSRGRPMPHYPYGTHVLGPGELWLFSPFHPLSFDSRYFGPVPSAGVRSRLAPVWTTGPVVPRPGGDRGAPAVGDR